HSDAGAATHPKAAASTTMAATANGQYLFATRFIFRLETAMPNATSRSKLRSGKPGRGRRFSSGTQPSAVRSLTHWEDAMRLWLVMWTALILPASASPVVSPEDAETM